VPDRSVVSLDPNDLGCPHQATASPDPIASGSASGASGAMNCWASRRMAEPGQNPIAPQGPDPGGAGRSDARFRDDIAAIGDRLVPSRRQSADPRTYVVL
jgi:hypothetical protein